MDSAYTSIKEAETQVQIEPAHPSPARGIYLLDHDEDKQNPGLGDRIGRAKAKYLGKPFIDGLALRPQWKDFGWPYNFSKIDEVCQRLQALGKNLSLYVDCEEAPAHVMVVAQETCTATVKGHSGFTHPLTCAPWDRPSLNAFKAFVAALANYPCLDSVSGAMVPFCKHPVLSVLRFNVIGRTHTARDLYHNLVTIPGWSRTRYIDACVECLTFVQDTFPGIPLHTGFFELKDGAGPPTMSIALIRRLDEVFDGVSRDRIGLFQELLTETKPRNATDYAAHLRAGRNRGFYIAFQAHNCWDKPFGNNPDFDRRPGFDGIDPRGALTHGHSDFGCVMYEMYPPDLLKAGWDSMIWEPWHEMIWQ